jgi:hypothetical protein
MNTRWVEEQPDYLGNEEQPISYPVMATNKNGNNYELARQALAALSLEQKGQLADEMGVSEDFPTA